MTKSHALSTLRPPSRGAAGWMLWSLRWLLVVLLVADQVGAPLHLHHHDSGVDALWLHASSDHADEVGVDGLEAADHHTGFGHSTLAVRVTDDTNLAVADAATDLDGNSLYLLASAWITLTPDSTGDEAVVRPIDRWRTPSSPAYRSLPPAGRAPPLHA
jgi:hypothetical protein